MTDISTTKLHTSRGKNCSFLSSVLCNLNLLQEHSTLLIYIFHFGKDFFKKNFRSLFRREDVSIKLFAFLGFYKLTKTFPNS